MRSVLTMTWNVFPLRFVVISFSTQHLHWCFLKQTGLRGCFKASNESGHEEQHVTLTGIRGFNCITRNLWLGHQQTFLTMLRQRNYINNITKYPSYLTGNQHPSNKYLSNVQQPLYFKDAFLVNKHTRIHISYFTIWHEFSTVKEADLGTMTDRC